MIPLFIAIRRFDPGDGTKWIDYVRWSKLELDEVGGLDSILCPPLLEERIDEDWNHIVNEDFLLDYFLDLDYLLGRVDGFPRRNILGLYRNPPTHIDAPPANREFSFLGYDLIENGGSISALTNCGGFPESFSNDELNRVGLVSSFARASEIRAALSVNNPNDPHAQCDLFAVCRLTERHTRG